MEGLKGKVVIVTGGAQGIGKATSLRFAKEGSKVLVADFGDGTPVVEEIKAMGGEAVYFKVNVANYDECQAMAKAALDAFGTIDVIINNAGITRDGMMKKMTKDQWDAVIAVNLSGVFNCTKAVLPTMLEKGSGVVLSASSCVGVYGNMGQTNYAACKWGVIGMSKTWCKEMASKGLRFNAVAPGFINTAMVAAIPQEVMDSEILIKVPARRLGQPEEIAAAYAFLASDDAKFINGHCLSVDGGVTL